MADNAADSELLVIRVEEYENGQLVERVEIERLDVSTVEYRRFDGAANLVEQRPATPEEISRVDASLASQDLREKNTGLDQAIDVLRQWAEDARNTTVTSGNAVTVLQVVVDRLGIFFDRFADLIETRR